MNIFEMLSFDFQEFVTSPAGILIIVGILFLLVGIVIFLKEGKKIAKPVEEEVKPVEAQPVAEASTPEVAPVAPVVESIQDAQPVVVKATEDGVNEVPVPTVTETLNIAQESPVVAPTEEIKVESLDAPVVEAPVAPAIETPTIEAPVIEAPTPVAPAVEPIETAQPTAYGGVSPEVGNITIDEKPREIYGGANPLENTAPIPTVAVNNVVEAPVAPVEPVAPVVEAPVAPAIPEVAPVAPAPTPTPSFEQVVPSPTPVAPVEPAVAPAPQAPVIEPPKEEIEKLEF